MNTKTGWPVPQRFEQWLDPATGERIHIQFDGEQTTVERGTRVTTHQNVPFDQAAALAAAKDHLRPLNEWSFWNVLRWQRQLISSYATREEAKHQFVALGFPLKLWSDIDAFLEATGQPTSPVSSAAYASSLTITGDDTVQVYDGAANSKKVLRLDDPEWKDNLLIHPTPEIKKRYAEMQAQQPISVSPISASASFEGQTQQLRAQRAVRLTARRPDGSLWLTPALEPYRRPLTASEKPVLRLSADKTRQPSPWDSKVGGVPYRLKGAPWPMSREATPRPLVFLAQLNLAQLNPGGKALPGYPSRGLLQFFILNSELYGAAFDQRWTDPSGFRVLYFPEVTKEASQLETQTVEPVSENIDLDLPFERDFRRAVALSAVADREMISGADDGKLKWLDLPPDFWEDDQANQVVSDLYDVSPGGHKVGGYPDFTQQDPRSPQEDWQLLFQLDSDDALGLMWGDDGTANFFIRPADLKKLDFSRVGYHWDCG